MGRKDRAANLDLTPTEKLLMSCLALGTPFFFFFLIACGCRRRVGENQAASETGLLHSCQVVLLVSVSLAAFASGVLCWGKPSLEKEARLR